MTRLFRIIASKRIFQVTRKKMLLIAGMVVVGAGILLGVSAPKLIA